MERRSRTAAHARVVGDEVLIKASGGIHTKEFAYEPSAGADRIGTSNSVELVTSGTAEAEIDRSRRETGHRDVRGVGIAESGPPGSQAGE